MAPHQVVSPFETRITELVRYKCSCGCLKPISQLYFCRHCLDVRCGFCVSHEVDSHYCPNCMENMPRYPFNNEVVCSVYMIFNMNNQILKY